VSDPAPARKKNWLVILVPVAAVVVATLLIVGRSIVASSYKNASGGMLPTFAVGEIVFVNRLDKTPARGKTIVFRSPENEGQEFVKRIVGVPGDTIEIRGTTVVVNGKPAPTCDLGELAYDDEGRRATGQVQLETLDAARYLVMHTPAYGSMPAGPWTVRAGEVFVMGDNRENSHDSRTFNGGAGGGVPLDHIVGTVQGPARATVVPTGAEGLKEKLAACLSTP
jgi:signal peptidase I